MGNWADPTILKDGEDYYMTHSSFDFHPGLLVWHSKDLKSWKPISRAVQNQKGSIWAPEIVKHQGQYRIYYPADLGNWVVTAQAPSGPWSTPQSLGVKHIDPGHVVGPDGKQYIHLSGGNMVELSPDGMRAVSEPKKVYEGWALPRDWAIECFCLESPKFLFRNGWYYLTSAEGGTLGPSTSHLIVSARSRGPNGPWENSPYNPIVKTWSREEAWWSKGHGSLVEGPDGKWYCVLHGVRNGLRTLGRPTLIEPIEWTPDGWFRVAGKWPSGWNKEVRAEMPMSDDFRARQPGIQWQFHAHFDPARAESGDGSLRLSAQGAQPGESRPMTLMPMHAAYDIQVDLETPPGVVAGLMLFASPTDHIGLSLNSEGAIQRVQQGYRRYMRTDEPKTGRARARLRIVNDKQDVRFYHAGTDGDWRIHQPSMDISNGGPLRVALFAHGSGQARFQNFRYTPLEY